MKGLSSLLVMSIFMGMLVHYSRLESLNWDNLSVNDLFKEFEQEFGNFRLPKLRPSKIGSIQLINATGKVYKVKTVGRIPPIFQIDNFLTPKECDTIIEKAKKVGLKMSLVSEESVESTMGILSSPPLNTFGDWDTNEDNAITPAELKGRLEDYLDFSLDDEGTKKMMRDLLLDFNYDGKISKWEFNEIKVPRLAKYIADIKVKDPRTKSRHSTQAWLPHPNSKEYDVTVGDIQLRISSLTGLPLPLIRTSEELQVVRYEPGGHYNCHLDTDDLSGQTPEQMQKWRCCHILSSEENCHVCRFATILYFLNDVDEGGETAFPIANNKTFDSQTWEVDNERLCNLARNCHKSNVVVKPEKGKAILWYNHYVSRRTGWLGSTDFHSFHGGCDVKRGIKWIANQWFNASPKREADLMNWARAIYGQEHDDNIEEEAEEVAEDD